MNITYKVNDNITITSAADTVAEAFKGIASLHEVFGPLGKECGVCQAPVYPRVRTVDDNHFHEAVCSNQKCRAVLAFGQHKTPKGGLFPKRRDKDGRWIEKCGYVRWTGDLGK